MGRRTRIRWSNVGKLAGTITGVAALLFVLPGLLERPDPPPLPADVGLPAAASAPPPTSVRAHRGPAGHVRGDRPSSKNERRPAPNPDRRRQAKHARGQHAQDRRGDRTPDAEPEPAPVPAVAPPSAPAPSPVPIAAAPPPAPAPAPPSAPPPAPEPASPPPATSSHGTGSGAQSAPPEFGFEH